MYQQCSLVHTVVRFVINVCSMSSCQVEITKEGHSSEIDPGSSGSWDHTQIAIYITC